MALVQDTESELDSKMFQESREMSAMSIHKVNHWGVFVVLMGLLSVAAAGCSDAESGCRDDGDCRIGRVCVERVCLTPGEVPAPGTDTGVQPNPPINDPAPDVSNPDDDAGGFEDVNIDPGLDTGPGPGTDVGMDVGMDTGPEPVPDAGTDTGPEPVLGPIVRVSPPSFFEFGRIPVGARAVTDLYVENIGDRPLVLTYVDLGSRPSQGFDISPVVSASNLMTIEPGASMRFDVVFAPSLQSQFRNSVRVHSNDPANSTIVLELRGASFNYQQLSCLTVSPTSLDFGTVGAGGTRSMRVTAINCSNTQNVTITEMRFTRGSGAFDLGVPQMPPFRLPPMESVEIEIRYRASGSGLVQEVLELRSDAALNSTPRVGLQAQSEAP
jgi:hypothetical protein